MFVVHGTKKFRERVRTPAPGPGDVSTTALGNWYATVLFWKPQVALFVNETTLLPVLEGFAPAATVIDRFPADLARALRAHQVSESFMESELAKMDHYRLAPTANRSVIGVMNEFAYLAEVYRSADTPADLLALSLRLARTPCGPLYGRQGSPDRELAAVVGASHP
jgi:hypothetical protein